MCFRKKESILTETNKLQTHKTNISILTQSIDELPEVEEPICVLIQQTEDASSQGVRVGSVCPGEQQVEQTLELLHINAVLLQVW